MNPVHSQFLETALKAQRRLTAMDLKIVVNVGISLGGSYICLKHIHTDKYRHFETLKQFRETYLEEAKELCKPRFIKVTKACIDLIGNEVYLDKVQPYIVKSILSKTTILTECGEELDLDRVYMKE